MAATLGGPNPLQARVEARKALHAPTPERPVLEHHDGEVCVFCAVLAAMVLFITALALVASLVA